MILILIFGEALALYGLIVSLILTSQGWQRDLNVQITLKQIRSKTGSPAPTNSALLPFHLLASIPESNSSPSSDLLPGRYWPPPQYPIPPLHPIGWVNSHLLLRLRLHILVVGFPKVPAPAFPPVPTVRCAFPTLSIWCYGVYLYQFLPICPLSSCSKLLRFYLLVFQTVLLHCPLQLCHPFGQSCIYLGVEHLRIRHFPWLDGFLGEVRLRLPEDAFPAQDFLADIEHDGFDERAVEGAGRGGWVGHLPVTSSSIKCMYVSKVIQTTSISLASALTGIAYLPWLFQDRFGIDHGGPVER